jgi:GR25 family glycosyltransferase involved in LPS biosynthesis
MESIINKIYVITTNNKRFESIKNRFDKIKVIKCNAVGDLTDEQIKLNTTSSCNLLCSSKMINSWLSHYNLWKQILKRGEDNVLILEDTAVLDSSFNDLLPEYWKEVPDGWDMIYFGCEGSCDKSFIKDTTFRIYHNRVNNDVYKNNKKMVFITEPGFPLGLYGYMLSLNGVKKLVNNKNLLKVNFNIDQYIAKEIIDKTNFKAYAFKPQLIKRKHIKKHINKHNILEPFTDNIKISKHQTIKNFFDEDVVYIRQLGINVTYFTVFLAMLALIIGYNANIKVKKIFLTIMFIMQLCEMAYTKTDKRKLKMLFFELLVVYVSLCIGQNAKLLIKNQKN